MKSTGIVRRIMTARPPSCPRPCPNRRIGCQSTCDTYQAAKEWHEARRAAERKESLGYGIVPKRRDMRRKFYGIG